MYKAHIGTATNPPMKQVQIVTIPVNTPAKKLMKKNESHLSEPKTDWKEFLNASMIPKSVVNILFIYTGVMKRIMIPGTIQNKMPIIKDKVYI